MTAPDPDIERRLEAFAGTCRRQGLKLTHQRTEVFRELAASTEHPDAETIYRRVSRRIPSISRDTVCRTLATLEAHGLVRRAEMLAGSARFDANMDRHHHFVCNRCGRVYDFYSEAFDEIALPKALADLGCIESCHVQLRGICADCARAEH